MKFDQFVECSKEPPVDNTQLYIAVSQADSSSSIHSLESAISALSSWFSYNII